MPYAALRAAGTQAVYPAAVVVAVPYSLAPADRAGKFDPADLDPGLPECLLLGPHERHHLPDKVLPARVIAPLQPGGKLVHEAFGGALQEGRTPVRHPAALRAVFALRAGVDREAGRIRKGFMRGRRLLRQRVAQKQQLVAVSLLPEHYIAPAGSPGASPRASGQDGQQAGRGY